MKRETVLTLTTTFEAHAQQTDNGVEYWLARDLQYLLGYAKWDNFEGVVRRAANIITHRHLLGTIEQTTAVAQIGSGAQRNIVDFRLDRHAVILVAELAQSHKLTNVFSIRSETVVLQLVQKYCRMTGLPFQHQFRLEGFVFDCAVGHFLLIEFDEPHHQASRRQRQVDTEKERVARENGWVLFRVTLEMDIVDVIVAISRTKKTV